MTDEFTQPEELNRFHVPNTDISVAPFDDGVIAITNGGSAMTVTVPLEELGGLLTALGSAYSEYSSEGLGSFIPETDAD